MSSPPKPPKAWPVTLQDLLGDRPRLGDVVAAAGDEVGALEPPAEEMPATGAGGDGGLRLARAHEDGLVRRGDVLLLTGAGDLHRHVARRRAAGGGVEEDHGAVVSVLHAQPLVGMRIDPLAVGIRQGRARHSTAEGNQSPGAAHGQALLAVRAAELEGPLRVADGLAGVRPGLGRRRDLAHRGAPAEARRRPPRARRPSPASCPLLWLSSASLSVTHRQPDSHAQATELSR